MKQILPYLKIKQEQAGLMIRLLDYQYPCSVAEPWRVEAVNRFRSLNQRGEVAMSI